MTVPNFVQHVSHILGHFNEVHYAAQLLGRSKDRGEAEKFRILNEQIEAMRRLQL